MMDENFNAFFFKLRNLDYGDHNYDDYTGLQNMVRLNQDIKTEITDCTTNSQFEDETIHVGGDNNDNETATVTRTCAGPKSSVAIIYPCYLCNYETCRSTSLVAHLRKHRQGSLSLETERFQIGKFVCDICNFKTRWLSSLKEHEEQAHFNNDTSHVVNNRLSVNNGGPYLCRLCGYSTHLLASIGGHMKNHFNMNILTYNYPCCLCEFSAEKLNELQDHFSEIHCTKERKVATILFNGNSCIENNCEGDNHITTTTEQNDSHEYPCDYCSYRSANVHLWRDHMASHGGVLEISLASMRK